MPNALLICHVGSKVGAGHLSRIIAIAEEFRKDNFIIPEILIFGDIFKKNELANYKLHIFSLQNDLFHTIEQVLEKYYFDVLIFDIFPKYSFKYIEKLFLRLRRLNISLISIDSLIDHSNLLDIVWVPSFKFDHKKYSHSNAKIKFGWDSFLISKKLAHKNWMPGIKVLVLTGSSDLAKLGEKLPTDLDQLLASNTEVNWVRGPFSNKPKLPKYQRLNWIVHNAPKQLDKLIVESNYVITVFGVSLFEVLQYGIPTVVFSPYKNKDDNDLLALSKENVALVVKNSKFAVKGLVKLMGNNRLAKLYSKNSLEKMSINGVKSFTEDVYLLMGIK